MSRDHRSRRQPIPCFPRVSGDEPLEALEANPSVTFSPRERG